MSQTILPGATLGVLGSGQLGRMFAIAARRMGYRVHVLSPDSDTPTGQVADVEIKAAYDDLDAIANFAKQVSVVTFEFENVPSATTEVASKYAPVRPSGQILHTTQNRSREKTFLSQNGFPVPSFALVHTLAELQTAVDSIGLPAVLKTASWGYDGKGQAMLRSAEDVAQAWETLNTDAAVLEAFVDFQCELSVIAARGIDGQSVSYGPMLNDHVNHILDLSTVPADLPAQVVAEANEMAQAIVDKIDLVGVLCVELFLTNNGQLLVNELAPRPHNSGHITIDTHVTCQFEQQVRAACGLPLGSAAQHTPGVMVNLLGDLWQDGEPDWAAVCSDPNVKLHLYGKQEARPGRKMGHLNVLGATPANARAAAIAARQRM